MSGLLRDTHPYRLSWRLASAVVALTLLVSVSCTEEVIQFRDRELFNPPADSLNGFLGYFDISRGLTACGNCHIGVQGDWENSAHAGAYASLVESGHAQDFCFSCHTVSSLGNATETPAGWEAVQDSAYHDVQCESCHGPGLVHVQEPGTTQPVPALDVTVSPNTGCAECHSGAHHPFADEWAQSPHAQVVTRAADRVACQACHRGQAVLEAWGVDAEYVEKGEAEHLAITCGVCHDPHGSANSAQLRFPIDVPNQEQNLCIKCHHKRAEPEVLSTVTRGPHSPEGPLLLGEGAGWFPPGFEPEVDSIFGTHGSGANPRLCATCHVAKFTVTDPNTGDFRFSATGHLFAAIPCVDSVGIPTLNQACNLNQRSFQACTASGCHGSATVARSAFVTITDDVTRRVRTIDSLLALVPPAENVRDDGIFTVADGVWFNARLAELDGSGTHNPFLIRLLLNASEDALRAEYGL